MTQGNLKLNDYWSSADLALVTAISLHYPIDSIDRTHPQKATFLFKREEGLDELVEKYWRREFKVEPQLYFQQLKAIKARLYAEG